MSITQNFEIRWGGPFQLGGVLLKNPIFGGFGKFWVMESGGKLSKMILKIHLGILEQFGDSFSAFGGLYRCQKGQ